MIRELRRLSEKHKDDSVDTFATNWSALGKDVANRLEELLKYKHMYEKMYNKKYCLTQIIELRNPNPMHEEILDTTCYLAYLNPGERGWFLCDMDDMFGGVHRIHTSVIKDVEYKDDNVVVSTQNTRYTFKEI